MSTEPGELAKLVERVGAFQATFKPHLREPIQRAGKLCEEAGEVIGAVIKMGEGRKTKADLAMELGQLVICAAGLSAETGIDLSAAVADAWDDCMTRDWSALLAGVAAPESPEGGET